MPIDGRSRKPVVWDKGGGLTLSHTHLPTTCSEAPPVHVYLFFPRYSSSSPSSFHHRVQLESRYWSQVLCVAADEMRSTGTSQSLDEL